MTKHRKPNTPQAAISEAVRILGRDVCADTIGKSESLIYKLEDPDGDNCPSLVQAMQLDAECIRIGGVAPVLAYYDEMMERVRSRDGQPRGSLSHNVMRVTAGVGKLADMVQRYAMTNSEGGEVLTANERVEMLDQVKNMLRTLRQIDRDLSSTLPTGISLVRS